MSDSTMVQFLLLLLVVVVVFGVAGIKILATDEAPSGGTFSAEGWKDVGRLCLAFSAGVLVLFTAIIVYIVKFRNRD